MVPRRCTSQNRPQCTVFARSSSLSVGAPAASFSSSSSSSSSSDIPAPVILPYTFFVVAEESYLLSLPVEERRRTAFSGRVDGWHFFFHWIAAKAVLVRTAQNIHLLIDEQENSLRAQVHSHLLNHLSHCAFGFLLFANKSQWYGSQNRAEYLLLPIVPLDLKLQLLQVGQISKLYHVHLEKK